MVYKRHFYLLAFCILFLSLLLNSVTAATYYTYTNGGSSGLWADATTWTTDPSGVTLVGSAVPGNNDIVHILNGYTVALGSSVSTTGLSINIHNGGTLDLVTFTMATITSLSGSGTLKIQSGYFPTVTSNTFLTSYASGSTVEFYDFTGALPISVNYPNLTFTNSTTTNHTITFSNTSAYTFTIFGSLITRATNSGSLTVSMGTQNTNVLTMNINGNLTVGAGTVYKASNFNAIHSITAYGNVINNGNIDLSNAAQYSASSVGAAHFTFAGATDNSLACNGVTDFYTLTINKGLGSSNILSVTSTNTANLNFYSNAQLITVAAGTLKLGSNINIPRLFGSGSANYDLGSSSLSPMLWIDGAIVNANSSALVVYGKFRITNGSFTSVGGQGTVIREEGQYLIEGGTFNTEKFRPSTTASTHRGSFTMTGGIFNASGSTASNNEYARFSLPFPEQVFIMSGGTINVNNPEQNGSGTGGGIHIGCKASNFNVTGGTFNAILSGGASSFKISSTAPFWNLNISRTGGTPTTVQLSGIGSISGTITTAQPLVVSNNFIIDGANNPIFNANGQTVTVGGAFIINSGGTYTPSANTTIFSGSIDQNFTNNGTITTGLYNLTINKPSGTLTFDGSAAIYTITQSLSLYSGVMNDGGKTIQVAGDIENRAIHTGTGNVTLNGTTTQTIAGDGNGIFGNLILNNSSNPGAILTSNLTISGTLTLAGTGNSLFDIEHYLLSLTSTSANALITSGNPFSNTKMIRTLGLQSDRGVRKTYGNLSAFTFAFGVGNQYTPAVIQLTTAPTTYGTIAARPVNSRHQFVLAGNTNNLTWYWKVVSAGFTGLGSSSVNHSYYYLDSHVAPSGDDATYVPARYNPTTWTVINNTTQVDETNNIISFSGVGYIDGDFTAGRPAAFGTVNIFYSKRNGNWTNTSPGTTPWSNVSHTGPDATTFPGAGDQVYIGDGVGNNHIITITANNQSAGGLEINTGSTLDVGTFTGHNFGRLENAQISGSGLLRISSATATAEFPAGDFGNFIRASGGTVEYYTSGSQNFTIPLNSNAPTLLPLISYKNLLLSPGASRSITFPDQDERIFGNMTVQGAASNSTVLLNAVTPTSLWVNGNVLINSGDLQFMNGSTQTITIDGNLTVASGGLFTISGTGSATTHSLNINGNIINNGVLDLSNGSYTCNTTFTGAANTSITGTGSVTDFNVLTVSKGTSIASILNVNASNFSISASPLPLVLNTGTFRLSSPQTITIANGVNFNIPATARLSANGGTIQTTGGNGINLLLAGTLEILSGSVNVGTTGNDNSLEYSATGLPTIIASGGNLNINSQIRRSFSSAQGSLVFNQSGSSVITVGLNSASTTTRGVFEILNPGSSFTMSGGTLRIWRPSGSSSISDLYLQASTYNVTGGTIQIGGSVASQTIDINTIIPVYNLSVAGSSNTARLELNPIILRGSLTIDDTDVFNANGLNVSIAGNLTNNNTSSATGTSAGGYRAGSATQSTTLNGNLSNQMLTGVAGNLTNFANLTISNTFTGGTVSLQPNTNLRINGNLIMTNGTVAGNSNTITALATVFNSVLQTNTAGGSITLAGSGLQNITGNGSGRFGNLIINNASGALFGANQEIQGTLTFINGSLNISSFGLYLSNTSLSSISGTNTTTRYIITSGRLSDAGVTKAFAGSVSAGSFEFPVGVAGKFTPVNYTITTGATGGNSTIIPVNSKHPSATGSGLSYVNYYWNVNHAITNLISLTHTYTYAATDESGTPVDYRDARFIGGAWTIGVTAGNPNTINRVITFTNIDATGDYTAGEPTAFVNPTTYTSIASGNWESDGAVWDIDPPGTNLGPPPGSFVIISQGNTVTVTANTKRTASLEVRGRLHLGSTTAHDFGTVTTSGAGAKTIQIGSSTFPTGNFSNFTSATGGTIEYDGTITLPTQGVYNHLSFTSSGSKTLPNADLLLNGNLTIAGGTVTNSVNNRNITLTSATGDFLNQGTFVTGTGRISVGRDFTNSGSFSGGNGTQGMLVNGNFTNSSSVTLGSDSLLITGTLLNTGTFNSNTARTRVAGNLNNTAGTITVNSGSFIVSGSLTNNSNYNGGNGSTTVSGSFANTGVSASFNANNSILNVAGNFSNTGGATFNTNAGLIQVGGNWTNSSSFSPNSGVITFNGSGTQTITGVTTFNNFTKSGSGSVLLQDNITINGVLSMAGGKISTGSNVLRLNNSSVAPITGFTSTSFVDGILAISYPNTAGTSRVFPIGKGNIYRPVTIQQTVASSSPVVRVEMINTPPTGSYPSDIERLSEARYYDIDLIAGTMNSPIVEISFNTNGTADESITVPGNVRILRATNSSGPWTDEGGSGVFSPAAPAGYATSGITSFSSSTYFTLGYQSVVLPITLASFEGELVNGNAQLHWVTFTEENNDYFTIERSSDGRVYDSIGWVEGAGNSISKLHYHYLDSEPLSGISYYRLKQTDYDLHYSYSNVIMINNSDTKLSGLRVFPNPVATGNNLWITFEGSPEKKMHITITDMLGRVYFADWADLSSALNVKDLPLHYSMERGTYLIKVVSQHTAETRKVIIF